MAAVWRMWMNGRIAAVCDVDRGDLVGLVLELADVLEVYAPDIDPGVLYSRGLPEHDGPLISRDLQGGAGLVDMATELSTEAMQTLAEVLAAAKDYWAGAGREVR